MDIELVNTEDKPITGITKRLILTNIQKTNTNYSKLVAKLMKADRELFYENKQLLIDLMEKVIEHAFIEGQRTGTKHIKWIKGEDNGTKAEDVYKKRSDNYVGD